MAHIRIINEDEATGTVAEDYEFLSWAYTKNFGKPMGLHFPAPKVFRPAALLPPYCRFGTVAFRALSNDGDYDLPQEPVPLAFVLFGVADASTCFY